MKSCAAFVVLILICAGYWYWQRPISYPSGVLLAAEPRQIEEPEAPPIQFHEFNLKPLAHFAIEARLLHSRSYHFDHRAALVPVDLALGWGPMSDQSVLDHLKITQSMRFFWFEYQLPPPIPKEEIIAHSTNLHVIPATDEIAARCKSLRTGALVHLSGELVEATGPGMGTWRSSLSRTDTGNGACELMWVTEVRVINADELSARHVIAGR